LIQEKYQSKKFPHLVLRDYTGTARGRYHLITCAFIGDDSEMGGAESVFFLNKISKGAAVSRASLKGVFRAHSSVPRSSISSFLYPLVLISPRSSIPRSSIPSFFYPLVLLSPRSYLNPLVLIPRSIPSFFYPLSLALMLSSLVLPSLLFPFLTDVAANVMTMEYAPYYFLTVSLSQLNKVCYPFLTISN
jgi:hypothetical protein